MLVFCCVWQPHRAWTSARGKYLYTRVCSVQLVRPERKRAPSCLRPKENYLFFLPSRRALQRWDLTGSHGCRCTRSAEGGHPPDISACSFNSPCKSLQLVFSLERCQAGDSPSVRRAVKSSWRSKFVRNLFLLKSVSSIKKNKSRKTKTKKQGTRGAVAVRAPAPFHDLWGDDAAVHGALFTRSSQSARRAKPRDAPRGQHSHFLVPKKPCILRRVLCLALHAKCACRMCLVDWHLSTKLFQQVKSLHALELGAFFM